MEYAPVQPGACTLTIRRAMLPIAKWYMEVDDNELYELKGGAVVQVSVEPGTHTLSFCHVPHKPLRAPICFEVSRDMDMTVKTVSMGLASGFSLYEGTRIVGTEKLTKLKKK